MENKQKQERESILIKRYVLQEAGIDITGMSNSRINWLFGLQNKQDLLNKFRIILDNLSIKYPYKHLSSIQEDYDYEKSGDKEKDKIHRVLEEIIKIK